ncbi:ran-specific GTPase-activating protein-like [Tigriopus californicus]|uniref:ran-specific GTPase-activating protein-like n=1 Tax=Tigriopus californicus TaxID=6832 RepID=UPI0027D9DC7F|nr:ran-specific GTPase-activating protein-like [Tigriopus californicus]
MSPTKDEGQSPAPSAGSGQPVEKPAAPEAESPPDPEEHDPYYPPVITLPEVIINSGEEDEDELFRMRSKLFRYDSAADPPEWKERGTGDIKILQHKEKGTFRVLMRRDKTLKLCANHIIQSWMVLKPNCGSDRAFVWSAPADFADGEAKQELLAIRFANAENAKKFKIKFEAAVKEVTRAQAKALESKTNEEGEDEELAKAVDKVDLNAEKENLKANN